VRKSDFKKYLAYPGYAIFTTQLLAALSKQLNAIKHMTHSDDETSDGDIDDWDEDEEWNQEEGIQDEYSEDAVFYRTDPLLYHKLGDMVIFRPGNLYSLCSLGNQHYQKIIFFSSKRSKSAIKVR